MFLNIYQHLYLSLYMCPYIYMYRYIHMYIYVYMYIFNTYIYMYVYIYIFFFCFLQIWPGLSNNIAYERILTRFSLKTIDNTLFVFMCHVYIAFRVSHLGRSAMSTFMYRCLFVDMTYVN